MTRLLGPPVLLVMLVACGSAQQHVDDRADARTSSNGSGTAVDECQTLIDGETYTAVIDAQEISMDQLRNWYKTRYPGAYSPSQVARVPAEGNVTVCELEAPGIGLKTAPQPTDQTTSGKPLSELTPAVILELGLEKEGPFLDTAGPRDSITELMLQLH